jgi:hypothetical protein
MPVEKIPAALSALAAWQAQHAARLMTSAAPSPAASSSSLLTAAEARTS